MSTPDPDTDADADADADAFPQPEIVRCQLVVDDPKLDENVYMNVAIAENEFGMVVDDDEQYMATTLKMAARQVATVWKQQRDQLPDEPEEPADE